MKHILGLDLGTNSIGWALIKHDFKEKEGAILGIGSRIIPMGQDKIGDYEKGNPISQTSDRTRLRGVRRIRERHLLRRERLHRVLNILGFLPEHYANEIDFEKKLGQFKDNAEPKIAYHQGKFLYQQSFDEMLKDFKKHQPELLVNKYGQEALVPYDWALYYLRKKGLTAKLTKEELAWIILNFNQKRGYYQLRGEEEETNKKETVLYHKLKVLDVIADEEPNAKGQTWYSIHLENGWIYRRSSKQPLDDWKGKEKEFIVTTQYNEDGTIKTDKEGKPSRSFRAPKEEDWTLLKKKTENEIDSTDKTVGAYIYDTLLSKPNQKIRGKLIRTIERKYYKYELKKILTKQRALQPEYFSNELYNACIEELYKQNEAHKKILKSKDFVHLIVEDIIFYQRPLRSQKALIQNCSLETRTYQADGIEHKTSPKAIAKSNPYYQEFRVWQWLYNLKIRLKDNDQDVTESFLGDEESREKLFDYLMTQKEVTRKDVLKSFFPDLKGKALNEKISLYKWNYVYDPENEDAKKYPMNETGYEITRRLKKVAGLPKDFINPQNIRKIWHILYSVTDKHEYEKALKTFGNKHLLDTNSFYEAFKNVKPYPSDYGTFSEKAIKKLLPLMRLGKYWKWENIDTQTRTRIENIINGVDDDIRNIIREKAEQLKLEKEADFKGLPLWICQYLVYNRLAEAADSAKWRNVLDLDRYLEQFKQHSLRNPIVEQVMLETLRVVKDVWLEFGNGEEDFFDEIHIELGRELKHTSDERKKISSRNSENENTNLRIKGLLMEFKNDPNFTHVRPNSPTQLEILRIYEEGALLSVPEVQEDILKISKKAELTRNEMQKYKMWLDQKYCSPYTGQTIPLSKLFGPDYEIEHVIPQSRFFDDSYNNKVICEASVNKLKDNQLGLEFIKKFGGQSVPIGYGKEVKIFQEQAYKDFVNKVYKKNHRKKNILLLEDIPDKMIDRQMNDTRYISKHIMQALSNLVRSKDKDEGVNSKNLIPVTGKITTELKHHWGLNDIWNDLILPRFERMNQLEKNQDFTTYNTKYQKYIPTIPIEHSKGFQKKRIDHRHHALDALVVACTSRDHVNLLNNQSAQSGYNRYDLQKKLKHYVEKEYTHSRTGEHIKRQVPDGFKKPWKTITEDTRAALEKIIVSFKQNTRVINKATNRYQKWVMRDGQLKKEWVEQKGTNWSIRKPLHKDTVFGKVQLQGVKVPKGKLLTATRKSIDTTFNLKTISSITDTGIQKILTNYLKEKGGDPEVAFTPEALEDMNRNIALYNDGKPHKPIYKARIFVPSSRFQLGQKGNKNQKYVEAAKGTNLYFAVYEDEKGKRNFASIPLNEVIERQKQRLPPAPDKNEKGHPLLFTLSPNDLVYVPEEGEIIESLDFGNLTKDQSQRIYKMVSSSSNQCFFMPMAVSIPIVNKKEFSPLNKMEKTTCGIMIKDCCIKLKTNRLGKIKI